MLTVEQNTNGSWVVTALVADGQSCGPFYKSITYYDYTKSEACREYLKRYGKIIVEEED